MLSLCALAVFGVLVSLGVWQLQRLSWKEALIARMETRIHEPAVGLPPESTWGQLQADDYDYRHVTVSGVFEHQNEMQLFFGSGHVPGQLIQPGYLILTPLRLNDGTRIIINRGFVPQALRAPATRPATLVGGPQTITGLMRPPEPRNAFTPVDDPASRLWYTRDPVAMAASLKLERTAPFTIDADAGEPQVLPAGGATVFSVPNNHLSYALTWFGLAATLAGVFIAFVWRREATNRAKRSP